MICPGCDKELHSVRALVVFGSKDAARGAFCMCPGCVHTFAQLGPNDQAAVGDHTQRRALSDPERYGVKWLNKNAANG